MGVVEKSVVCPALVSPGCVIITSNLLQHPYAEWKVSLATCHNASLISTSEIQRNAIFVETQVATFNGCIYSTNSAFG